MTASQPDDANPDDALERDHSVETKRPALIRRLGKNPPKPSLRFKFWLTGVALPTACLIVARDDSILPDSPWQSGQLKHLAAPLVYWPGHAPFLPLILYSMIALTVWTVRPHLGQRWWVRLGIFTGGILSLQYFLILLISTGVISPFFAFFAMIGIWVVVAVAAAIVNRWKSFTIRHLLALTTLIAALIAGLQFVEVDENPSQFLAACLITLLAATPTLNFVTYARVIVMIGRSNATADNKFAVASWIAWLLGWAASWKLAVFLAMDEYSNLPMTDPNCYVSSAAAHGHSRLVGRTDADPITPQMQRLKFLEFCLQAAFPTWHKRLRRIYNRIGPPMAAICRRNVWLADASYLMLKPVEFLAVCVAYLGSFKNRQIAGIYRNPRRLQNGSRGMLE